MTKRLTVEIWSDIACPWCYVGKRRLEAALGQFPHRDAVDITWRAFELDPSAPRVSDPAVSYAERLAKKYGGPTARAEQMIRTMTETAAGEGLDFHFEKIRPGNTFDAHRLVHLGAARGKGDAIKERLLRAYLTEGASIGDHEVLARLASEVGLDTVEVRAVLAEGTYAKEVRDDEAQAQAAGIRGVPFFVMGGRYAASGAQAPEVLLEVLEAAWEKLTEDEAAHEVAEGAACGPDGCN